MAYYALLASLPMLTCEGNAGITPDYFLSCCSAFVDGDKFRILEILTLDPEPECFPESSFAQRFSLWECALRNAIVHVRSEKWNRDPSDYIKKEIESEADSDRLAATALSIKNPLERERYLDQVRWEKIEEMEFGGQFTFDQLCAYKLKLLIQQKWIRREQSNAAGNLELAVESVCRQTERIAIQEENKI